MAAVLLKLSTVLYVVATMAYLGVLLFPKLRPERLGIWAAAAACLLHLGAYAARGVFAEAMPPPLSTFPGSVSMFTLALGVVFLGVQLALRRPVVGAFVTPLIVVGMITVLLVPPGGGEIPDSLRSTWLPIHISMAFLGNAALAIAAAVALLYLIMERKLKRKDFGGIFAKLPSLETLDNLNYNLVRFGFVLLSMAIITGTLWAGQLWESYFNWEPRQTSAMVVWLLFAGLIVARWLAGWRGRRAAWITIVGFTLMVGSFLILQIFEIGRHAGTYT